MPSNVMLPFSRSRTCTSHGSKPAAYIADAISRSPLEPSSRMIATRYFDAFAIHAAGVSRGSYVSFHAGLWRFFRPSCSCSLHAGFDCSLSSSNDVASHRSCSFFSSSSSTTAPFTRIVTWFAFCVVPITLTGTSASAYAFSTAFTFALSTSTTRPSSSLNRYSSALASVATSSTHPQSPPKHISSTVVIRPPSLRS